MYTQKGSNLRPAVDKTAALPTETYGCCFDIASKRARVAGQEQVPPRPLFHSEFSLSPFTPDAAQAPLPSPARLRKITPPE